MRLLAPTPRARARLMLVFMAAGATLGAVVSWLFYQLPPPYQTRVVLGAPEEVVPLRDEVTHRKWLRRDLQLICEVFTDPRHEFWFGRYYTGFDVKELASIEADFTLDPHLVILTVFGSSDVELDQAMRELVFQFQSQTRAKNMPFCASGTLLVREMRLVSFDTKQVVFWPDYLQALEPVPIFLGLVIGMVGFVLLMDMNKHEKSRPEEIPSV